MGEKRGCAAFGNLELEEGAQVKLTNMQTELTWPRVSAQLHRRVPPFPQLTNSRLQTTAVGLPAPYEPHAVRVTTRGHAVKKSPPST